MTTNRKTKAANNRWRPTLFTLLYTFFLLTIHVHAQTPSWSRKAASAIFTLKTFDANGSLLASSNGFFTGESGEAVSSFSPFKGAHRAVVIDAQGKEYAVESMIGANDIYDVAKFQVEVKKVPALAIAPSSAQNGAIVWVIPYSVKKEAAVNKGTVSKAEQFQGTHAYYTLALSEAPQYPSSPVFNDTGEVIGLLQQAANGTSTTAYAVSAAFVADMKISGLSMNDATMRETSIPKAIPSSYSDAVLALYVSASAMDKEQYADYISRFIRKFPDATDGYVYRARQEVMAGNIPAAEDDMQQALKVAEKKDDIHYQYAQLIFQKELLQAETPHAGWNLSRALEESKTAYDINPLPIYLEQQAQILYAQQEYDKAYNIYIQLARADSQAADMYYAAAQCKSQQGDADATLALLDSAVSQFTKPYVKTAAPYLLARAQVLHQAGKYRQAVTDYNDYASLMAAQLGSDFYYLREQSEFAGHLYQQAIDDIRKAVELAPSEPVYFIEKANVELRVGLTDEALLTAQRLIQLDSQQSEGYLLLGIAQCIKGEKVQGLQQLNKAKELGNNQAQTFIEKYSH